jgi:hypothetical protein
MKFNLREFYELYPLYFSPITDADIVNAAV